MDLMERLGVAIAHLTWLNTKTLANYQNYKCKYCEKDLRQDPKRTLVSIIPGNYVPITGGCFGVFCSHECAQKFADESVEKNTRMFGNKPEVRKEIIER